MSIEDRNLKPGTVLKATYRKKEYTCHVVSGEGGKLTYKVGNKTFTSPSRAGTEVMGGVACNGWRFWTVEGSEKPKAAPKAKASTKAAKAPTKAKNGGKAKERTGRTPKVAGGANGEPTEPPVEKPVTCGDCGQEFATSREAGEHMRDAHNSVEAAGSGGR